MSSINNYQKGWALRCLREARAGLTAAQETPPMASSLILDAMRKAQVAIYYSLGDPASIDAIVRKTLQKGHSTEDPILKCLVEIERMVQKTAYAPKSDPRKAIQKAHDLIRIASEIVELFTGERAS